MAEIGQIKTKLMELLKQFNTGNDSGTNGTNIPSTEEIMAAVHQLGNSNVNIEDIDLDALKKLYGDTNNRELLNLIKEAERESTFIDYDTTYLRETNNNNQRENTDELVLKNRPTDTVVEGGDSNIPPELRELLDKLKDNPPKYTTLAVGEEGGDGNTVTTLATGEEGGSEYTVTTDAVGEEGGGSDYTVTTDAVGEEGGGQTNPGVLPERIIETINNIMNTTTKAMGEEGGGDTNTNLSVQQFIEMIQNYQSTTTKAIGEEGGA